MVVLNTNDLPRASNQILPPGTYTFSVNEFVEKVDKNNNPFMNVKLQLVDDTKKFFVFDRFYLSHAASKQAQDIGLAKLRAFLEACGFQGAFNSETDGVNFIDTTLTATVKTGKDMNGDPKTEVQKYLPRAQKTVQQPPKAKAAPTTESGTVGMVLDLNTIPF